jgi:hypothetical protein
MCWIYRRIRQENGTYLYTVGYYAPYADSNDGMTWEAIEDFSVEGGARSLVHYLNGGN